MLAALFLGFKRIWVWGWVYEAKAKECEFWQKTALDLLTVNDKAITVAERDG